MAFSSPISLDMKQLIFQKISGVHSFMGNNVNSTCFDSTSFCEKFESNFSLVSSGAPVLINFHEPK